MQGGCGVEGRAAGCRVAQRMLPFGPLGCVCVGAGRRCFGGGAVGVEPGTLSAAALFALCAARAGFCP